MLLLSIYLLCLVWLAVSLVKTGFTDRDRQRFREFWNPLYESVGWLAYVIAAVAVVGAVAVYPLVLLVHVIEWLKARARAKHVIHTPTDGEMAEMLAQNAAQQDPAIGELLAAGLAKQEAKAKAKEACDPNATLYRRNADGVLVQAFQISISLLNGHLSPPAWWMYALWNTRLIVKGLGSGVLYQKEMLEPFDFGSCFVYIPDVWPAPESLSVYSVEEFHQKFTKVVYEAEPTDIRLRDALMRVLSTDPGIPARIAAVDAFVNAEFLDKPAK